MMAHLVATPTGRIIHVEKTDRLTYNSPFDLLVRGNKWELAERVGFEPTCPLRDKTLSRRPRYDHFGTSPQRNQWCRTFHFTRIRPESVTVR